MALPSENIVLSAPMSFHGSTVRLWRVTKVQVNPWVRTLVLIPSVVMLLLVAWSAVAAWYVAFSFLLIPFRLIRRGQRRDRQAALRHREMLAAQATQTDQPQA